MPSIVIVAGEASGDASGAALVEAIRQIRPDVTFWGAGGPRMRDAGVEIVSDFSWVGSIGVVEAARVAPKVLTEFARLKKAFTKRGADVFVPIDFGAFNVRLGKFVRELGIKTVYYFPPGSWRKRPRDNANLLGASDRIITPFPWSQKLLADLGADVVFPGHPMLDWVESQMTREEFREAAGLGTEGRIVGLLPGSRAHEIDNILPTMLDAAKLISASVPDISGYIIAAGSDRAEARIGSVIKRWGSGGPDHRVVREMTYDVMAHSDLVITCSGTATLETMILGTPMIIVYKGSKLMKLEFMLRKRVLEEFIGMPNIVAGREICPELVADEASPEAISRLGIELLTDAGAIARMKADMLSTRAVLGEPGGTMRAAREVLRTAGL